MRTYTWYKVRSQVLRFGETKYTCRGKYFRFYYMFKINSTKNFQGTTKFGIDLPLPVATGLRGIATLLALLYENCLLRFVSRSLKYAILLLPVFEHFKMILAQQQTVICLFLLHRFQVRSLRQRRLADEHHVTKFICNTVIRASTAYNATVYETSS